VRRALIAIVVSAGVAATPSQASELAVVAGPGSAQTTFTNQVVVIAQGDSLRLVNADAQFHSVRSDAKGSDSQPWCGPLNPGPEGPGNPRRFPIGKCPLFWSDLSLPLGGIQPILGVELAQSGPAYPFACGVHPEMTGVVIPL